jgi:hypothetical protein
MESKYGLWFFQFLLLSTRGLFCRESAIWSVVFQVFASVHRRAFLYWSCNMVCGMPNAECRVPKKKGLTIGLCFEASYYKGRSIQREFWLNS